MVEQYANFEFFACMMTVIPFVHFGYLLCEDFYVFNFGLIFVLDHTVTKGVD